MEKTKKALIIFLRGQDACHGSSEYPVTLNWIAPLIIAASKVKKIKIKSQNFAFFKGYIYTRGIFAILTINAPK